MEHEDGMSVLRFMPYDIDRKNKKIKFDKPVDKAKPTTFFKDVVAKTLTKNQ